MANTVYTKALEGFLGADIDWTVDNIKAVLVDGASYTPNLATHQFRSDIPAVLATSGNLASKTLTGGVADAADVTISPGPVAGNITYVVLFKDTGVAGTSRLICLLDTAGGSGLPVAANSTDVSLVWDNGATKIFKV